MAVVTVSSDFGAQENKVCHCFHCFPIYLPWSDRTGCQDLCFLNVVLSQLFHSPLSFSSRLLSSFSLSAITVVSSVYLRLLIFSPAILIPACASSNLVFWIMYSAYKLNKQGNNIQPWHTPFPNRNLFIVPCPVLTVASWPTYWFLETGNVVRYSISFKNFPEFVVIHTVKGFSVVNETEVFLELSCFFYDPVDIGNLISGSSAFSKSSLNIWKFLVHILLKPNLENFELACEMRAIVQ